MEDSAGKMIPSTSSGRPGTRLATSILCTILMSLPANKENVASLAEPLSRHKYGKIESFRTFVSISVFVGAENIKGYNLIIMTQTLVTDTDTCFRDVHIDVYCGAAAR